MNNKVSIASCSIDAFCECVDCLDRPLYGVDVG
jgi:hypothetical protein